MRSTWLIFVVITLVSCKPLFKKKAETLNTAPLTTEYPIESYFQDCAQAFGLEVKDFPKVSCNDFPNFPRYFYDQQKKENGIAPLYKGGRCFNTVILGYHNPNLCGNLQVKIGTYVVLNKWDNPVFFTTMCTANEKMQIVAHEPITGNTCFFNDGNGFSLLKSWDSPQTMNAINNGGCTQCHGQGPYVHSPLTASLALENILGFQNHPQSIAKRKTLGHQTGEAIFRLWQVSSKFPQELKKSRTQWSFVGLPQLRYPNAASMRYNIVAKERLEMLGGPQSWTVTPLERNGFEGCKGCHKMPLSSFGVQQIATVFDLCGESFFEERVCLGFDYVNYAKQTGHQNFHHTLSGKPLNLTPQTRQAILDYAQDCLGKKGATCSNTPMPKSSTDVS